MTFFQFLKRPHPFQLDAMTLVLQGIAVFFIIVFLIPFGFLRSSLLLRIGMALLFIAGSIVAILGVMNLWRKMGKLDEDQWTIGKEINLNLQIVTLIALFNCVLVWALLIKGLGYASHWGWWDIFWNIGLGTLVLSVIPVGLIISYEHYYRKIRQLKQVMAINAQLTAALQDAKEPKISAPIALVSEQGKPVLQLLPTELLFVRSDGNYVEVFYQNETNSVQRTLIRNRLKNILDQLPEAASFNCHKRYIINPSQIIRVEGNARNIEVFLRGYAEPIPISRSKTQTLQDLLMPA